MPDSTVADSLHHILHSLDLIEERFSAITVPEDFVRSAEGILLLDAISMRLQTVCEHVKRIETKVPGAFQTVHFDPLPIIRFRDFISHHYDEADYEIIFDICTHHLHSLRKSSITLREQYV